MKKQIPNIITGLNFISGLAGIYFCSKGNFLNASYSILIAMIFDFLDGAFARALKCSSDFGKQFDSLADLVSFGIVPGLLAFGILQNQNYINMDVMGTDVFPFLGFLIPLFSAVRLAMFNVDTRQTTVFYGLPTPANAIFWASLPILSKFSKSGEILITILMHPYFIMTAVIILSLMLVSNIKMVSLKFKNLTFKDNWQKYVLLFVSLVLFLLLELYALPFIVVIYVILSLLFTLTEN